jgi:hypothetical protein
MTAEESQAQVASGQIVYGIVRAGTDLDGAPVGVAGASVRAVVDRDLAAVVSRLDGTEARATRQDLMSHSRVLEHALRSGPVLPLRFGTVFRDPEAVVSELLGPRHDELAGLLARFETAVELRVKAFYIEEQILREVVRSDPGIAALSQATRGLPEETTRGQRVRLGEAVARAVEARRARDSEEIIDVLRPLAQDISVEGEAAGGVALAASFLLDRSRVPAFDREMNELARRHEGRIRFKYLGPLPPHSFVAVSGGG